MSLLDLIKSNRSCRRFDQSVKVESAFLRDLVELARLSASAGNLQPLKYMISADEEKNQEIFSCLGWAAYLKDWKGPGEGEKPSAYIVIVGDKTITGNFRCDHGIAAQSILLGAREKGFAGCMLAAINHKKLRSFLDIDEKKEILLVIALGKSAEEVRLEKLGPGGDIKYWRDENSIHHVPKRSLDELIVSSW
ncbi:MAG: nitroreductase family protein [Thermodesulfobacteriota bacterium]|nr:nitroreductase family protein [Thermodesulfobacteriota bacterium]